MLLEPAWAMPGHCCRWVRGRPEEEDLLRNISQLDIQMHMKWGDKGTTISTY